MTVLTPSQAKRMAEKYGYTTLTALEVIADGLNNIGMSLDVQGNPHSADCRRLMEIADRALAYARGEKEEA